MDKKRIVVAREAKLIKHKFKSKQCSECGKMRLLDNQFGEWCWYCGTIQEE